MKKHLVSLVLIIALAVPVVLAAPARAFNPFADACSNPSAQMNSSVCKTNGSDPLTGPTGLITKVTRLIAFIAGVAAVIMIIISGIKFATSGGDANNVASARRTLIYSVVGLVVVVLSESIISFILNRL